MNLRNVLRAYSLLRVLSDDEAALLETLRAANDNERQLIADAMSDKPQKKSNKKSAGGGKSSTKSTQASGMAAQLNKSLQRQRHVTGDGIRCTYQYPQDSPVNAGLTCDEGGDNSIHDPMMGYAGYHEFVPPATHAATGD